MYIYIYILCTICIYTRYYIYIHISFIWFKVIDSYRLLEWFGRVGEDHCRSRCRWDEHVKWLKDWFDVDNYKCLKLSLKANHPTKLLSCDSPKSHRSDWGYYSFGTSYVFSVAPDKKRGTYYFFTVAFDGWFRWRRIGWMTWQAGKTVINSIQLLFILVVSLEVNT